MDSDSKELKKQNVSLDIKPIETSKDDIEQPYMASHSNMYIPPLGSSMIISGKSGSGKSTLLANLITDERFYKDFFDDIYLFSPTANGDDIQKSLGIKSDRVYTDLEEAIEILEVVIESQQSKLDDAESAADVPQILFIFDDFIGDNKFMNSKAFSQCFYQVRHINGTAMACTQHFRKMPLVCRQQANFVFFFEGSVREVEMVREEFSPPNTNKREFEQLIIDATADDYSFLTINMKVPARIRFRRNLDDIIDLKSYGCNNKQNVRSSIQQDDDQGGRELEGEGCESDGSRGRAQREHSYSKVRRIRSRETSHPYKTQTAAGGKKSQARIAS